MKKIGVIGVGNPLRHDDGVGIHLLNFLRQKEKDLGGKVLFFDGGTEGMNLVHIFAKLDVAIILDAVNLQKETGCFRFFRLADVKGDDVVAGFSSHEDDLLKIIALSESLGELPEIYFFGVQPGDISFGEGFSMGVEKNLDVIKQHLLEYVKEVVQN